MRPERCKRLSRSPGLGSLQSRVAAHTWARAGLARPLPATAELLGFRDATVQLRWQFGYESIGPRAWTL